MRLPSELSLIFMELMDSRSVPSMPADPQAASCCEPCAGARSPGSPCDRLRRDPQAGGGGGRLAPHHAAPAPSARSAATCVSQQVAESRTPQSPAPIILALDLS